MKLAAKLTLVILLLLALLLYLGAAWLIGSGFSAQLQAAAQQNVAVHRAECYQERDGLWVMNPGTCGSYGGSAGMLLIEENQIQGCWLLYPEDLLQK